MNKVTKPCYSSAGRLKWTRIKLWMSGYHRFPEEDIRWSDAQQTALFPGRRLYWVPLNATETRGELWIR